MTPIRSYDDLHAALRAAAEERNLPRTTLDELAGLGAGYVAKLLAGSPTRGIGPVTMGPLLGVLGKMLLIVDDPEAQAMVDRMIERRKIEPRDRSRIRMRAAAGIAKLSGLITAEKAKIYGKLRWDGVSEDRRTILAKRAAAKRWGKPIRGRPASRRSGS